MRLSKKFAAVFGAACLTLAGLAGCSGSGDDSASGEAQSSSEIANATEPVTASKAFNTKSVWYGVYGANPDRLDDGKVIVAYVFDGKGNITYYILRTTYEGHYDELYLTDLDGLSEDEIIEIIKEKHKALFLARIEAAGFAPSDCSLIEESGENAAYYFDLAYAMPCDEAVKKMDTIEYKEPQPVPFQLKYDDPIYDVALEFTSDFLVLNKDDSDFGKYVESPELIGISTLDDGVFSDAAEKFPVAVGKTYYSGYTDFLTIVNKDHPGFILDTPSAEGATAEK